MDTTTIGRQGEETAAVFLERAGYEILARNFRTPRGEIDIVASKGRMLAFVEVNGKHLYFNLAGGQVRQTAGTLRDYEAVLLAREEFTRIHRSYIVNMMQISELSPAGVRTFSGKNLPVSRLLYPQLQKDYMKLLFLEREG